MLPPPMVSVLVVSWNRSADLRRALEAVFASTDVALEVVVVDNASTDDAAAVAASFAGVRLVKNTENVGFAAAVEQGLAATTGELVALVNNDAVLAPDCLSVLARTLEAHPEAAAAGGKQYFWDDENPLGDRRNHSYGYTLVDPDDMVTNAQVDADDALREVATLSGAVVLVRRSAIQAVGAPFLDPLFFAYYEETDFFSRAVRKGFRLLYTGEAVCWHRVRASTASEPYRYLFYMYRNRVLWAYRNFDEASLDRVLADTRTRALRAGLLLGAARRTDEARARRDAHAWARSERRLLLDHRARFFDGGPGILALAARIQSRASYYGHARPEVAALVPAEARQVIDFGCGGGAFGRALKAARPAVEVRGVEPVPTAAALAREGLDDVHVGGADDPLPEGWPRPDCVVFADVLEHLVDPWATLRRVRTLLAPGGALVVSIPNVLHHSVVADLARGRFDYQDAGVLDRTHLRFFTAATARELVEHAGFRVERMERVIEPPRKLRGAFAAVARGASPTSRRTPRAVVADLCTVQYLILAR